MGGGVGLSRLAWLSMIVCSVHCLVHQTSQGVASQKQKSAGNNMFSPYCAFGERQGFSGKVWVFVDSNNQRSFTFNVNDMGTQTLISCQGPAPEQCVGQRPASTNDTQSCDDLDCQCSPDTTSLQFVYMQKMMNKVLPMCSSPSSGDGFRILLIGLGGGALPEYMLSHCPTGTKVESVEYDPRVVDVATNFFGLKPVPGVNEIENSDGGEAVQRRVKNGQTYDVVLVDCFQPGDLVPDACRNQAFVQGLRHILKPGGTAIQQIWARQLDSTIATYQQAFGTSHVAKESVQLDFNFLILAEAKE